MSISTLPVDVQCMLLTFLPDFSALNSLILTSRSMHSLFVIQQNFVLKCVAENFLGTTIGEEIVNLPNMLEAIKFLVQAKPAIDSLELIVFRFLEPDADLDVQPTRRPSLTETARLRRAVYRFAIFCSLSSQMQQSLFLDCLQTMEVFEMLHLVEGLRKMILILLGDAFPDADWGLIGRLVSTGPVNICRLWTLHERKDLKTLFTEMTIAVADSGTEADGDGAFDDAFRHFEILRNISAFDATRTRPLLDEGHLDTQEVLLQLESLMVPPPSIPLSSSPRRPRFRSLGLPICDTTCQESARLPFLPDDLNSLPIWTRIPYAMVVLNGEPRILPLTKKQLAELADSSSTSEQQYYACVRPSSF
ncbi:hypothetical protein R3P38DRAFT_2842101 [Favolaschia claudopus]|uniref:F-box domain-containing protein n=1 Tax=Favolaschia claudopus TaxID=2862362 RepID=A0AAW0E1S5_9AGAR